MTPRPCQIPIFSKFEGGVRRRALELRAGERRPLFSTPRLMYWRGCGLFPGRMRLSEKFARIPKIGKICENCLSCKQACNSGRKSDEAVQFGSLHGLGAVLGETVSGRPGGAGCASTNHARPTFSIFDFDVFSVFGHHKSLCAGHGKGQSSGCSQPVPCPSDSGQFREWSPP